MTTEQKHIACLVSREIAPWVSSYRPGPWLTQQTAARFQASAEHAAITYVEERALTGAVESVLGVGDPATPFIVAGLKQVLDAETPAAIRFAREHPEVGLFAGVGAVLLLLWKVLPD